MILWLLYIMYFYSHLGFIFLVCKLEKEERNLKNNNDNKKNPVEHLR